MKYPLFRLRSFLAGGQRAWCSISRFFATLKLWSIRIFPAVCFGPSASVRLVCSFAVGWIGIGKGENWTTEFLFRCDATVFFCKMQSTRKRLQNRNCGQFFIGNEYRLPWPPSREFTVGAFQLGMKLISQSVRCPLLICPLAPSSALGLWPGLTYLFLSEGAARFASTPDCFNVGSVCWGSKR